VPRPEDQAQVCARAVLQYGYIPAKPDPRSGESGRARAKLLAGRRLNLGWAGSEHGSRALNVAMFWRSGWLPGAFIIVYACLRGVHEAAWNHYFAAGKERFLLRLSALCVGWSGLLLFLLIFIIEEVEPWSQISGTRQVECSGGQLEMEPNTQPLQLST
jgi:hypothetical protein